MMDDKENSSSLDYWMIITGAAIVGALVYIVDDLIYKYGAVRTFGYIIFWSASYEYLKLRIKSLWFRHTFWIFLLVVMIVCTWAMKLILGVVGVG